MQNETYLSDYTTSLTVPLVSMHVRLRHISICCRTHDYTPGATRWFFFLLGIRYFIERSSISVILAFKKTDGRNEIRYRRWRYFIVPDDRFRCEIPTMLLPPTLLRQRRSNCKLKASSASNAISRVKYSLLSASLSSLKLAPQLLHRQRSADFYNRRGTPIRLREKIVASEFFLF